MPDEFPDCANEGGGIGNEGQRPAGTEAGMAGLQIASIQGHGRYCHGIVGAIRHLL